MKLLHTADWHLGKTLHGRKRYAEFEAFLDWLVDLIEAEAVEGLLIAGDIFDTTTPSNRAQELYYGFLHKVAASCCRDIVIIGGNHDSPSFLNAPKSLLKSMRIHVVGAASEVPEDEIVVLRNAEGQPTAVVCAVPYLRDRDVRRVEPGEAVEDKGRKLVEGITEHYAEVCRLAEARRTTLLESALPEVYLRGIPLIAMGHLFAAGGRTGEGERDLYVGSLALVTADAFPISIDYLALGHLHVPQTVGERSHFRYSGSPLAMGYGEVGQEKQVVLLDFVGTQATVRTRAIPVFQPLCKITGDLANIEQQLAELIAGGSRAWLDIEYTGLTPVGQLRELIHAQTEGSALEILRVKNRNASESSWTAVDEHEVLDDLSELAVFERCLESAQVPPEERPALEACFRELLQTVHEEDTRAS